MNEKVGNHAVVHLGSDSDKIGSHGRRLRVLMVEDNEDDALLVARELRKGGYELFMLRVDTLPAMAKALKDHTWDIVISDHMMPSFSAPAALALLKERKLDIPFLIVSGCIGEDVAVAAMKAGASDFLLKDNLVRLIPVVERELREAEERRGRTHAEEAKTELEMRMQAIFENAADGIIILNDQLEIDSFNRSASRQFGYQPEEAIGKPISILLQDESVLEELGGFAAGRTRDVLAKRKDGTVFTAEIAVSKIAYKQKDIYTVFIRDVTERYETNRRIRKQVERLEALRVVEQTISSSLDINVALNAIVQQAVTQLGVDAADVLLFDSSTLMLQYAAGKGFHTKAVEKCRVRAGEDYPGKAVAERSLVTYSPSRELNPSPRTLLLKDEGFVEARSMPLIAKGQVKGVIEVFNRSEVHVDEQWSGFFESLAAQAALAIDNATLFNNLQRTNLDLELAYDSTLKGWSRALDLRDKETEGHTERVVDQTLELCEACGVRQESMVHIRRGALLHDIGKMGIPDSILLKEGPLTEEEWQVMRLHPVYALQWLTPIQYLKEALDIPYCHHERWDGTGYPRGLKGEEIPLAARIFAVVDVWDALTSDRPYRKAWSKEQAREYIANNAGTHFDPEVVEAFLKKNW